MNRLNRALGALQRQSAAPGLHTVQDQDGQLVRALPLPQAVAGNTVASFRVKTWSQHNRLVCRTWDGTDEGEDTVLVAKPYDLQRTRWDYQTINGVYYLSYNDSVTERDADYGTGVDREIITPDYYEDRVILAVKVDATKVVTVEGNPDVEWLDLNIQAQAWMREETL